MPLNRLVPSLRNGAIRSETPSESNCHTHSQARDCFHEPIEPRMTTSRAVSPAKKTIPTTMTVAAVPVFPETSGSRRTRATIAQMPPLIEPQMRPAISPNRGAARRLKGSSTPATMAKQSAPPIAPPNAQPNAAPRASPIVLRSQQTRAAQTAPPAPPPTNPAIAPISPLVKAPRAPPSTIETVALLSMLAPSKWPGGMRTSHRGLRIYTKQKAE